MNVVNGIWSRVVVSFQAGIDAALVASVSWPLLFLGALTYAQPGLEFKLGLIVMTGVYIFFVVCSALVILMIGKRLWPHHQLNQLGFRTPHFFSVYFYYLPRGAYRILKRVYHELKA